MSKLRFLVVDDAIFMRTVLKKMLTEEGFEVVGEAGNGLEAIQMAAKLKPDIITLDITMPEMNGIKAVPEILKVSPKSKIIICSALGQQAMVVDAIRKGAKDFIVKPFEKYKVYQTIQNVLTF